MAPVTAAPLLELSGISKRFPGVRALHQAAFQLNPGEVLALIGENGAGKSTLVKILTGLYTPDEGHLHLNGTPTRLHSARDAWTAGITAIHQETVMFQELSVAENIFIGHMPQKGLRVDWAEMKRRSQELLDQLEVDLRPEELLKNLSIAQRHIVEIARALSHDAQIVIMDEPTAALSQREVEDLYRMVRRLREQGKGILFISHKFEEVFELADRYVVLRDGEVVGTGEMGAVSQADLVRMMVGRPVDQVFPKVEVTPGPVVLEVENLRHPTEFADISFSLRAGEILGFYGLVGAGRTEVMQALFGLTRPSGGTIRLKGQPLRLSQPADAIQAGIVYVPEDRQGSGAILPLSIRDNITLPTLKAVVQGWRLNSERELALSREYGNRLDLRASNWAQHVEELSGGNQQKVVIAKWLATQPQVIILDEPTKGIDVGSKSAVHAFMGELVQQGLAVILVSSELPEVLGMADRIAVMRSGRIGQVFSRDEASAEKIVAVALDNPLPEAA